MVVDLEDLIASTSSNTGQPSIIEALLSTVDSILHQQPYVAEVPTIGS